MAFPTTKVTFSVKAASETIAEGHINDLQTVVEALEDKVGIDSGGSGAASHDYLLTHLPTQTGVGGVTDLGPVQLRAETLCSDIASGIPVVVTSTTMCTNLNADTLDGNHAAAFQTVLTNSAGLAGALSDETGYSAGAKAVFSISPVLTTPNIGEATATKVNGLTIDTTTGTLDITNAKTLTVTGDATISATPYVPGGTDVAVVDGGTGSGTAAGARSNLGAAASGANSDITALSGLATALSTGQGGTGSTANANAASGVVVLDASSKIPVAQLGSWVDKSASYGAQQAATDGFITAWSTADDGDKSHILRIISDSANPPTVYRSRYYSGSTPVYVGDIRTVFSPVKKGDYWMVEATNFSSIEVYWIPLGA